MRSVLADRPDLTRTQLERTRALMDAAVQNSLIRDYEHRIEELELPDPDDRHVLAAAIVGGVQRILTFNTKDFPAAVVASFGIDVQDPDSFVLEVLDGRREVLLDALRQQRSALRNPPLGAEQLLAALAKAGLARSAHELTRSVDQL